MRAEDHVVLRWQSRSKEPNVTRAEVEHYWSTAKVIDVPTKEYDEARHLEDRDVIMLAEDGKINTVIFGIYEKFIEEEGPTCEWCGYLSFGREDCRKCNGWKYKQSKDKI